MRFDPSLFCSKASRGAPARRRARAPLGVETCEPRTLLAIMFKFSINDAPPVQRPTTGVTDAVFTVSLSSPDIEQDLFVDYKTVDGTAVAAHGDYTATSGFLTFPFNETSLTQTIKVPIPANPETLPVQNFSVVISLPPPGSPHQDPENVVIDRGTGIGTINNPAVGQVQFSTPTFQVGELDGSALITVTKVAGPGLDGRSVGVSFAITGGTAVAGVDYLPPTSNMLTFGPTQNSASFAIPILVNPFSISNKTINLTLLDPTGGVTLGSPSMAVLTIVNVNPLIVTNTNDSGIGSLRQAITTADTLPFAPTITFDIPGANPHTIAPPSPLPVVSRPMTIDANTQPGYAGHPIIELSGSALTGLLPPTDGLMIKGGSTTIRGLVINRFPGSGIVLEGAGDNHIIGDYLGTDLSGTHALPNSEDGVFDNGAPGNTIADDLVSGNGIVGVLICGPPGNDNVVTNNRIGTDVSGMSAVPNGRDGVFVFQAPGTTITGNLISGNGSVGVQILGTASTGNVVSGNRIGTNAPGTSAVPNASDGVFVNQAPGNTITGNVISRNRVDGVQIVGGSSSGNVVTGNSIIANGFDGLFLNRAPGNTIGAGNVIAGNGSVGIQLLGAGAVGNSVMGNAIQGNGYGVFINGAPGYNTPRQRLGTQNTITGNRIARVFQTPTPSAAGAASHPNRAAHVIHRGERGTGKKR